MTRLFCSWKSRAAGWLGRAGGILLFTVLFAVPVPAQFVPRNSTQTHSVSLGAGFRAGPLKGATELEDQDELQVGAFIQRSLWRNWQGELGIGYGQLTNTDYSTDMILIEGKMLYSTFRSEELYLYLYGGLGIVDYDIATWPDGQIPGFKTLGLSTTVPVGAAIQIELTKRLALELSGGYTYTFSDEINGAKTEKGNDAFWSWTIGLRIEELPRGATNLMVAEPLFEKEPEPVVEEEVEEEVFVPTPEQLSEAPAIQDQDEDGLSDRDERQIHFTNPLMADSDDDGLLDGTEIQVHQTNPNRADTDGGGVRDGAEIARDADPLDGDDDARLIAEEMNFPKISFALNGTKLVEEGKRMLDGVVRALDENPLIKLEVRSYTDSIGETAANLRLAQRRAQTVRDYLVDRGIAPERLSIKALGEADPIASNETLMGQRQNRRVELVPDL
jgi:outer membrane protein OmpA-like peptidoglycan-associated protein